MTQLACDSMAGRERLMSICCAFVV